MARSIRQQIDSDQDDPHFARSRDRAEHARVRRQRQAPQVGQVCNVRGVPCRVIAIRDFGTVDVVAVDGSDRAWRVSGLGVVARGNTGDPAQGRQ